MAVSPSTTTKRPLPRVIAVAGGKGGVGKSTVAANLASTFGLMGQRTVIVDADLGSPNLHTMLGIVRPTTTMADFFDERVESLDDTRLPIPGASPRVHLIAGTSQPGAANLAHAPRQRLIRAIAKLDADVVVVDIGAGSSFNVIDLVIAADLKLFVITPHLPSLHNAYALLKACVYRIVRRLAHDETQQSLIDAALGNDHKARTVAQLLDVLRPLDELFAARVTEELSRFGAGLVVNQVERDRDHLLSDHMTQMIRDHLSVRVTGMGSIRRSRALAGGLKAGAGTIATEPIDALAFRALARAALDLDLARVRGPDRVNHQRTMPLWLLHDVATSA